MSDTLPAKTYAIFAKPINKKLAAELRADTNSSLIEFPAITAEEIVLDANAEIILEEISAFDWLIFPDVYSVEFFLKALEARVFDFFSLDEARICAFGEAVSDKLRFMQIHADVIPARINSASIFTTLYDYLLDESEFENQKFLLIKEQSYKSDLKILLRKNGAKVTELAFFQLDAVSETNKTKLEALTRGGAIDEFIFTEPTDVFNLKFLFGEDLKTLLADTSVAATDEVTFKTLREHELRPLYFKKN